MLAVLTAFAVASFLALGDCNAANLTPWMTPVNVHVRGESITVDLCETDWNKYKGNPTQAPLGQDITRLSECRGSVMAMGVPLKVLEDEYEARGCSGQARNESTVLACEPAGIIQHEARVGSTLAANMLAVLPHTLVYSESEVPFQLTGEPLNLPPSRYNHVVRVVFAAFARPIAASAAGVPSARFPEFSETFKPDRFFLKLQSSAIGGTARLRAAFPSMPWLFLHREPVEVLMSLLRGADNPPSPDAPSTEHVAITPKMFSSPCLRGYRRPSPYVTALLKARLGEQGAAQAPIALLPADANSRLRNGVPAESHCAAEVARYCDVAHEEAVKAREEGLRKALGAAAATGLGDKLTAAASDGSAFISVLRGAGLLSSQKDEAPESASGTLRIFAGGIITNVSSGFGELGGIGQWIALRYSEDIVQDVIDVYTHHFRSPPLTPEHLTVMHKIAGSYSKARLGTNRYTPKPEGADRPIVVDGLVEYIPDVKKKQAVAWAAVREAADVFLRPLYDSLQKFAVPANASTATGSV